MKPHTPTQPRPHQLDTSPFHHLPTREQEHLLAARNPKPSPPHIAAKRAHNEAVFRSLAEAAHAAQRAGEIREG